MIDIEFLNKTERRVGKKFFEKYVQKGEKVILQRIRSLCGKQQNLIVSLTLVSNKEIAEINGQWRGKKGPTDVLSFSYVEKPSKFFIHGRLGDIIISLEKVESQAPEKNHTFREELAVMFVHGFLHVFGYDHQIDAQEAEMEFFARKILKV